MKLNIELKDLTLYTIILRKISGRELNTETIASHIEHLRILDQSGKLVLCGPFAYYPSGMIVIKAKDKNEATLIANEDPFVKEGFRTCEVRTWQIACKENNYLG